jgi:hypothetical protein
MRLIAGTVLAAAMVFVPATAEAKPRTQPPGCKVVSVATEVETFVGMTAPGLPDAEGIEITTATTTVKCRGKSSTSVERSYRYF